MLTLTPTHWFSWNFRVTAGGEDIAVIGRHWFRERAAFSVGGTSFAVRKTTAFRSNFVLERNGWVVAEARKPSAFRRRFELTIGGKQLVLRSASPFRREFRLFDGAREVGRIRPLSFLGRTATAELPETMPMEIQLFVIFLVLMLWKREADAGA